MVDLPQVPRGLVTTQAATSPVSPGDISAPYAHLGAALDKLGGALEDTGVKMSEEAGRRAVTTDDDGNPQVSLMPPIGKAAEAFNRTAQMTYLSQLEPKIKEQILANRIKYDGNPGAFHDWAQQYGQELADGQPSDELRRSVALLANRHAAPAYEGLTLARHQSDVLSNRVALKDSLDSMDNDMALLAREGGTSTEAYQGRMADYQARQKQAMTDPTLNYDETKAKRDLADITTRHQVWGIIGDVRRIAETKSQNADGAPEAGVAKAKALADSILTSDQFNLDQDTRQKYYRVAVSEIRQLQSENRVVQSQLNVEGQAILKSLREGNADAALTRDFMDRAAEAGATKALVAVAREVSVQSWYRDWFSKLPAQDRATIVDSMSGRTDGRSFADRLDSTEASGDPNARPVDAVTKQVRSSALGIGQFTEGTWLSVIKSARPDLAAGKTDSELLALRSDKGVAKEMIDAYAQQNAGYLRAQGVPVTDANLKLAHVLGPRDAVAVATADPSTPIQKLIWDKSFQANPELFARNPTAGAVMAWSARTMGQAPTLPDAVRTADNPTRLAFLSTATKELKSSLDERFKTVESTINSGVQPSVSDLQDLGAMVHAVGSDDQKERMAELGAKASFGDVYQKASPAEREQMLSQVRERYAALGSKFTGEITDYAATLNQRVSQAYKEDPYGASVQYGGRPTLPAVSPDQPDTLRSGLQARVSEQSLIRDQQGSAPFSALRPAEADAWKQVLSRGDVGAAGAFLGSVGQLPPDVSMATLTSKPIADGITGMVFSRDPQRMEVGLTSLDRIWNTDPHVAESQFGKDAIDRLQVWQGLRDSFSAAEISERFNTIDDPSRVAAKAELKSQAETETSKLTPADVAGKFVTGLPLVRSITGGSAVAPVDGIAAQQMASEFKTIRTALRTYGVDADKADDLALKRMQNTWGVSPSNNNQVMKYPPEKYYPDVAGSHAWIGSEIEKTVAGVMGPSSEAAPMTDLGLPIGDKDSSPARDWKVVGLAATKGSAARIAAGQPPAYSILIQRGNGMFETLIDPTSGRSAVTFDVKPYQDANVERLRVKEDRTKFILGARAEQPGAFANSLGN
ncbi:MAG: hypothetical protein HY242_09090 [Afipia sp.]|nr:hypothetical protein [Afipia sp.]